ncbi:glycosyl hydrolase family 28-related protein, partial [Anaerostipes sp.]|uniref:glycosyl hydrolase family 28-related protein n=1 Tax=Anaerostipes sp. TaxID=1872530 RepID=UPI00258F9EC5
FSAHILLLTFCYAWLRESDITFLEIFFFVLLGGFCKYFCDSRMAALCLLLLAVGLCVVKIRRMYDWITYEEDYVMNKGIQIILNISPVLCAAVIFILSFFYNPDFRWMSILNSVLSGRLALGRQGFDLYPVTLFGQKVEMNGFEGTTIEPESYFFLDSSYINILLCMGLLSLLCIIWILIRIIWIERQKMGWEHVIILGVLCIHSLAEHRLANIGYHPFLLLMFALPKVKCFCPEYFGIKSYLNSKIKGINYKRIICVILSICVFLSICIKGALILQDLSSSENSGREYLLREYDIPNDGSDCTEKLQNLIDDVYSNGGGSIIFDKGVYGIQSIELRSNVTLVGQGKENTVLKHLNGGTRENAFIYISDYIIGFSIEKMEIYGDKDNDKNVTNGIVFDVEATSKENTGDDEGKQVELRDLLIRDFSGDGCLISSGNSDIVLKNSEFRNNNMNGLEILSSDSTIENCIFAMSGQYGVINSGDNNSFSDIVCRENGILNHSSCGIYIYASDCTGNNIKSVGNHCNGICIMGDDNSFSDIVSESNGFIDEEGLTETASIWVEGNRNQVEGKCLKSDINQNPLNKYCVLMQNCSDCEIKIAADEKCSLNGLFVDQEQFIDFSK